MTISAWAPASRAVFAFFTASRVDVVMMPGHHRDAPGHFLLRGLHELAQLVRVERMALAGAAADANARDAEREIVVDLAAQRAKIEFLVLREWRHDRRKNPDHVLLCEELRHCFSFP